MVLYKAKSIINIFHRQLEVDENADADEWFPNILTNYETYVMHAYAIEESTINQTEYLKDYLKQDLHVRLFFNMI
jgi:hypothetical protein